MFIEKQIALRKLYTNRNRYRYIYFTGKLHELSLLWINGFVTMVLNNDIKKPPSADGFSVKTTITV